MSIAENMLQKTSLSFEVFPPKTEAGLTKLYGVMDELYKWGPDWMSCTYGAGGSNKGLAFEICQSLAQSGKTQAVSHYTCIHADPEETEQYFRSLQEKGVKGIMALRGDYMPGETSTGSSFRYATDLISFIRDRFGDAFEIGCTGIPEGHIQSDSFERDTAVLKKKQDLGADFIVTQLTFDMDQFAYWLDDIRAAGIDMPVAAGVMPVLNKDACIKHCLSMNGCAIPRKLARLISRYYNDPESFRKAGIDYTIQQIYEYVSLGVNDLHFYSLNESSALDEILTGCGLFTKAE